MRCLHWISMALCLGAAPVCAETRRVETERDFRSLIAANQLSRMGVTLSVAQDGAIRGRAFGQDVIGQWQWRDGFFCRDLSWGETDFGYNCQLVTVRGSRVRFTSDRGAGDYADLNLRPVDR